MAAKTISLALLGSLLASYLEVPLGAMFGAVFIILLANKTSMNLSLPKNVLTFVQLILGMSVGSMLHSPAVDIGFTWLHLIGLLVCMFFQVLGAYLWLHKKARWSKRDSLLASIPGAMAAILMVNESQDKPSSKVIFTHTTRQVVLLLLSGFIASSKVIEPSETITTFPSVLLLIPLLLAILSRLLLEKFGVPAPYMITGVLATLVIGPYIPLGYLYVPNEAIYLASSMLGALIALHLKDVTFQKLISYLKAGVIATVLSVSITVVVAYLFSFVLASSFTVLLMSWVPGSIETMTITAMSLGLDPSLVMLSHIIRMGTLYSIPLLLGIYGVVVKRQSAL